MSQLEQLKREVEDIELRCLIEEIKIKLKYHFKYKKAKKLLEMLKKAT